MLFFRVWIVIIASVIVVLSWWRKERWKSEDRQFARFSDLPVCYCFPTKLMVLLPMQALDNACYGSWRPLTDLTQTFWVCHLCTLNGCHFFPYIWRSTRHDKLRLDVIYCWPPPLNFITGLGYGIGMLGGLCVTTELAKFSQGFSSVLLWESENQLEFGWGL